MTKFAKQSRPSLRNRAQEPKLNRKYNAPLQRTYFANVYKYKEATKRNRRDEVYGVTKLKTESVDSWKSHHIRTLILYFSESFNVYLSTLWESISVHPNLLYFFEKLKIGILSLLGWVWVEKAEHVGLCYSVNREGECDSLCKGLRSLMLLLLVDWKISEMLWGLDEVGRTEPG